MTICQFFGDKLLVKLHKVSLNKFDDPTFQFSFIDRLNHFEIHSDRFIVWAQIKLELMYLLKFIQKLICRCTFQPEAGIGGVHEAKVTTFA